MMKHTFFSVALLLTLANSGLSGCTDRNDRTTPPPEKPVTPPAGLPVVQFRIDTATVWLEVADEDGERERGLMFRESMPDTHGMIFVFPSAEERYFWMKNTYLPLDIAYINAGGTITDIHQMTPYDTSQTYDSSVPVPYAIELNQGWFEQRGIGVGAQVQNLQQLSAKP